MSDDAGDDATTVPAESAEPPPEPPAPADEMPEDFAVSTEAIGQKDAQQDLDSMLGRRPGTAAGNIQNRGQTAVGAGAMAAEAIISTTINMGKKSKSWRGDLQRAHVEALIERYVRSRSDDDLKISLETRRVVYLNARPGSGRYAAAQVALAARHSVDRVARIQVAPGTRLAEVVDEQDYFADDHGHIIDAAEAHSIGFVDLLAIDKKIKGSNATVVVIGPFARRGHDLGPYLFEHRRSSAMDVFRGQLIAWLRGRKWCVGPCGDECRLDCVPGFVEAFTSTVAVSRHFDDSMTLDEASSIATALVAAAEPGMGLDDVLDEILRRRLWDQARALLRADDDEDRDDGRPWSGTADYRRAFRIAYAVLEGAPVSAVFHAADRLLEIQRGEGASVPAETTECELDCLLPAGMRGQDPAALPSGRARVARLANPELVPALLEVAWNERGLGSRLLRWLDGLAGNDRQIVRLRAAIVAGLLCFQDFDGVTRELVEPWVRSRQQRLRQAAGLSLMTCAREPALRGLIEDRLRAWTYEGNAYTRDSVAWAYAYGLGGQLPYDGLRRLRRIGADGWQRGSLLISLGVDETFRADRAAMVLDDLRSWIDAPDDAKRLQVHAARAFVRLARRRAGDGPELVRLAGLSAIDERRTAGLWAAALCLPSTAASAWAELTRWLVLSADVPGMDRRFLALMRELAGVPALRSRAAHQCRHVWRPQHPRNPLLPSLAAMIERT
ncbi:hypothetical protein Ade02nite_83150 [Paractinoplanes deccanensis]|uniref:HEAT repeat domain-containing protein n=1 Tax=Paractinoplanes deccanensis TaxID=113561 RepID=A0ABQ3YI39_9ACTN|nr:hypothetical protein [Actinoplanes deccanensis]GID79674.1 hypothetical protein Ade02nite_83150 [Actinoplanes deccanensis]